MAYLYRVAGCNNSSFKVLVAKVRDEFWAEGQFKRDYWVNGINTFELAACLGGTEKRPSRWVCPACVKAGLPDLFVPDDSNYMEFCLVHGLPPTKACPRCKHASKYGWGTYQACRCGHEWATTESQGVKEEAYRLYCQIAGDVPLGVEPAVEDLARHPLTAITRRLQLTWELLWTDNLFNAFDPHLAISNRPAFGQRWVTLVEALGIDQYKLGYWTNHIGCWLRSLGKNMVEDTLQREVPWTYLRRMILASYSNGCSGPRPSECVLVGGLCKSNRKGIHGDPLPRWAGTFLRPNPLYFVPGEVSVIKDKRPDPFGDEESESLHELANADPTLHIALIQLVAMGVIQPLKLTHPTTWRIPKGALQLAFRQWVKKSDPLGHPWYSTNILALEDFCRYSNMGELIYRMFVTKELHLMKHGKSFWDMQLHRMAFIPANNLWPLEAIHHAVLSSLSPPAKKAAHVAHGYLMTTFTDIEIELYCGRPGLGVDPRSSQANSLYRLKYEFPVPAALVWHRGELLAA